MSAPVAMIDRRDARPARRANRARLVPACAALLFGSLVAWNPAARADGPPAWVELTLPASVSGLRVMDADGDGIADVLVSVGRDVLGWRGIKGGLPAAEPTWTWHVPAAATFVSPGAAIDVGRRGDEPQTPTLLALAGSQALRLAPGLPPAVEEGLVADVPWSDPNKAVLTDFVRGRSLIFPAANGYRWVPDWKAARATAFALHVPPSRKLTPPGPFVEDAALLETTWPSPVVVPPGAAAEKGAVVALGEDGIHAFVRGASTGAADAAESVRDVRAATDALPRADLTRDVLVDLDSDGFPDLVREATTNDSGVYAFLTWPAPSRAPSGPSTGPDATLTLRTVLRLKGFQIQPDYVDLDGDGRLDFVVTTIDIDANNVMRAVMKGRVAARTRAFLNRGARGDGDLYSATPDAEIESEIQVRVLFTFSGAIDVQRSFTILATADLDGDGRKDLAIRTPEGTMKIHRGAASGVWAKEPTAFAIPPVGKSPDVEGYVGELTGDKKDDLVLLYRPPPGGLDRLFVVPSK
jgi:hypothetical protein